VTERAPGSERAFGRARPDLGIGAAILLFCLVVWLITLTFQQAPPALAQNVQPASFPRLVVAVIAVLTVAMVLLGRAAPGKSRSRAPAMVWLSAGIMVGFVLVFQWLGIVPAMVLVCLGLPVLWGERRWHLIIPFGVGFPLVVYALFAMALGVHFEPSPLAFW
jgi:putative tricarboxylic transport membrane protein